MAGVTVSAFTETVRLTGPTVFTGPRSVINDAQKNNYGTQSYLMRGQSMSDVVQGGTTIVDDIYLAASRKARAYRPGAKQSYTNPQTGAQLSIPYRMFITDVTWDDTEREINEGAARAGDRSLRYKDIWFKKQMNSYSDWCDFIEEQYWLPPDTTRMEAAGGDLMYSIPALINEYANGLPLGGNPGGAWTTKCGITPSAAGSTNFDNQRFGYQDVLTGTSLTSVSLLSVFKQAMQKLDFRPPGQYKQYFEGASERPTGFIACNGLARALVWQLYMASQNRWDNQMDPFGNPVFDGAPFVYVAALDGALIYPTGTGSTLAALLSHDGDTTNTIADGSFGHSGPRFWCIQPEYLRQIYHERFTMANLGVMDDRAQPTSHTMPLLTWTNLFPRSLRRHALVAPAKDTTGWPTTGG